MPRVASFVAVALSPPRALAETIRVPDDHASIQKAVDAAEKGDAVLVDAGRYRERIRLKPGVTLRSAGDDARGEAGLKRAEADCPEPALSGGVDRQASFSRRRVAAGFGSQFLTRGGMIPVA